MLDRLYGWQRVVGMKKIQSFDMQANVREDRLTLKPRSQSAGVRKDEEAPMSLTVAEDVPRRLASGRYVWT